MHIYCTALHVMSCNICTVQSYKCMESRRRETQPHAIVCFCISGTKVSLPSWFKASFQHRDDWSARTGPQWRLPSLDRQCSDLWRLLRRARTCSDITHSSYSHSSKVWGRKCCYWLHFSHLCPQLGMLLFIRKSKGWLKLTIFLKSNRARIQARQRYMHK